jgi:hypothetical protein
MSIAKYTRHCTWAGGTFSVVLERFLRPRRSGCLRSTSEKVAGLYYGVTIIIETDNPRFKVRRNAKYFVS